jgi:hypothetical protein
LFAYPIPLVNQAADLLFYDVGALDPFEWEMLPPFVDLKGTIIVVSPRTIPRADRIRHYPSVRGFLREEGDHVQAIAVAGVGSSVLGTASLARNIANYTGWDVAGIVTGFGLADLVVELLGGWFYYGGIDRLRYEVEWAIDRWLTPAVPAPRAKASGCRTGSGPGDPLGSVHALGHSEVRALYEILLAGPPQLRLLVGHSKGNLLISVVLNHLKDELGDRTTPLRESRRPLFDHLIAVTLGAVVDMPTQAFQLQTYQYLGQLDWLGQMNSDRLPPVFGAIPLEHEVIPGVGHHLNPIIPCSMSVADALRRAGVPRAGSIPPA